MEGLYRWDMETFRAVNVGWRSEGLTPLFWLLSYTGLSQIQILFVLGLSRWPALRRYVVPCVATIAFTGLSFAQVVKRVAPRERPSLLRVALPQEDWTRSSFVSGHTTTAFALATMLLLMTLGTRHVRWGALAMLWAFGVGVSRVYRGVHWPSDALGGACAGALGSGLLYLLFARKGWLDLTLERKVRR